MPCYQVITQSVEFKAENEIYLKKAIEKAGYRYRMIGESNIAIVDKYGFNQATINLKNQKISSQLGQEELNKLSNSLKRAYSAEVINEIAKKNQWTVKQMAPNQIQLRRF